MYSRFYLTFDGDYDHIIGSNKLQFMEEINSAYPSVACVDVVHGIVVSLSGEVSRLRDVIHIMDVNCVDLPSFPELCVTQSKCYAFEFQSGLQCSDNDQILDPNLDCADMTCSESDFEECCINPSPSASPVAPAALSTSESSDTLPLDIDDELLTIILTGIIVAMMCCICYISCMPRDKESVILTGSALSEVRGSDSNAYTSTEIKRNWHERVTIDSTPAEGIEMTTTGKRFQPKLTMEGQLLEI